MPHFFGQAVGGRVTITGPDAAHLARALRARPGEVITVVDGGDGKAGTLMRVRLDTVGRDLVAGPVESAQPHRPEPERRVKVALAMLPAPALEAALSRGTELGAHAFVLVQAERSVARGSRPERWAVICREAAMLAGRLRVPAVSGPLSLDDAVSSVGPAVILDRFAARSLQSYAEPELALFIGPEGGWTAEERARFGDRAASLGPRNLRAETAVLAGLAVALSDPA